MGLELGLGLDLSLGLVLGLHRSMTGSRTGLGLRLKLPIIILFVYGSHFWGVIVTPLLIYFSLSCLFCCCLHSICLFCCCLLCFVVVYICVLPQGLEVFSSCGHNMQRALKVMRAEKHWQGVGTQASYYFTEKPHEI